MMVHPASGNAAAPSAQVQGDGGRADHVGHTEKDPGRGTSAKGDDVDVVWAIHRSDDGLKLKRVMSRVPWGPTEVAVQVSLGPLRHTIRATPSWPAGTGPGGAAELLTARRRAEPLNGRGDVEETERWWRQAADQGHTNAMFNLGLLFQGRGEVEQAERWYRQAADLQGHTTGGE